MTPQENIDTQRGTSQVRVIDAITKGDPTLIGILYPTPDGKPDGDFDVLARCWNPGEADEYIQSVFVCMSHLASIVRIEATNNQAKRGKATS